VSALVGTVVVIGSVNVDITVSAPRLPGPGETVAGGELTTGGGGKGANAAVAAARADAEVTLVAAVGGDDAGRGQLEALGAEGIDTSHVATLDGVATGTALIVVDPSGDNQIAVASGANHALSADHVRDALATVPDGGCVLVSFEIPDAAIVAAAEAAARSGATLVVNPAPARPIPPAVLAARPILTPNQHEAAALTGEQGPAQAAAVLAARSRAPVVVTLGARGALLDGALHPAPEVAAVDATGAGDVFNGTLAAALASGQPLQQAVDAAVAAAAASVTRLGAR
jgi:ribokinase